jgi:phosphate transport system protein
MSQVLQRELEGLERQLLSLSAMAEEMIAKSYIALSRRDRRLASEVVQMDSVLDQREVEIEEECLKILAIRQPLARDLRRTAAILKINVDLERIGDLAVNIAQTTERLIDEFAISGDQQRVPSELEQMATIARSMVSGALDAFIQLRPDLASEVCDRDDAVDRLQEDVNQELMARAIQAPQEVQRMFLLMQVTHSLERIADHATNIAEDALFLVEGSIARHKRKST